MSPTTLQEDIEVNGEYPEEAVVAVEVPRRLEEYETGTPIMVAPIVIPPLEEEPISPQRSRLLDHFLKMGDDYGRDGSVRQAIELYFDLVNNHDGTDQAVVACDRLMMIAQQYEDNGELHLARGVYERLLKVS